MNKVIIRLECENGHFVYVAYVNNRAIYCWASTLDESYRKAIAVRNAYDPNAPYCYRIAYETAPIYNGEF